MLYPLDEEHAARASPPASTRCSWSRRRGRSSSALVKEALYGIASPPRSSASATSAARRSSRRPARSTADAIARAVGARLLTFADCPGVRATAARARRDRRAARGASRRAAHAVLLLGLPAQLEHGADDDALVGAGIGCHTMVMLDAGRPRHRSTGITQMGGEGAQWIGAAPFIAPRHFVQNLGDGTFHHSGSLAIRAAVAAGPRRHLQAALQRHRRDDRRPARRGPAERRRARAQPARPRASSGS